MKKVKKLNILKGFTAMVLAGAMGFLASSIGGEIISSKLNKSDDIKPSDDTRVETVIDTEEFDIENVEVQTYEADNTIDNIEATYSLDSEEDLVTPVSGYSTEIYTATPSAIATTNVNIRKGPSTDTEILGQLSNGSSLVKTGYVDSWNQVIYEGDVAYVSSDYTVDGYDYKFNNEMTSKGYFTSNTSLYGDSTMSSYICDIPYLEFAEIYGEEGDSYIVNTDYGVGYVPKSSLSVLDGKLVVVDKSTQSLKYYNDNNELVLTTPVVTGSETSNKYTPSDEGLFDIDGKRYSTYLKGPTWNAYVDVFMPYNGGEGLHDAEYHTHSDGFSHGWKGYDNFGGNYYINGYGSHGCINMRHDEAMQLADELQVGDKVLVKR